MNKKTVRIRSIGFYLLIIAIVLAALTPVLHIIMTSIRPTVEVLSVRPQWIPKKIILDHYWYAFKSQPVAKYLLNSVVLSVSVVTAVLFLGSLAAYGLARYRFKGDMIVLLILVMMRMIPVISILIPLYTVFSLMRLLDTLSALIIAHIAFKLPVSIWLLRSFFHEIPRELEDSARIDGCSTLGVLTKIVLPLARPGLVASAIICFLYTWNDLIVAIALTASKKAQPLTVGLTHFVLEYNIEWGPMCAAGVFMLIPILVFAFFAGKHILKGLVLGAVKE